ncbi:MAG TPA: hypothetical protein VGC64_08760 [Pyrinomonadaceae bacterium]
MTQANETPAGLRAIKRMVPRAIKEATKRALLARTFRRTVQAIMALPAGELPSRELLADLQRGWSNEGMAADIDYIEEVARRALGASGPVLECGSGLTTILLGLLAGKRGVGVWSLEHLPEWQQRVESALKQSGIPNVHVCLAPLKSYGAFSWYDAPLLTMPENFQLIVCDGPPEITPGGRYGLLPVMRERIHAGASILLDDANRASESRVLKMWAAEAKMSISFRQLPGGAFALATFY